MHDLGPISAGIMCCEGHPPALDRDSTTSCFRRPWANAITADILVASTRFDKILFPLAWILCITLENFAPGFRHALVADAPSHPLYLDHLPMSATFGDLGRT